MIFSLLGLCDHIIYIHLNLFMHHVMKKSQHGSLVVTCVLQTEWHNFVTICSPRCNKSCLCLIFWSHFYLVKPSIKEYVELRAALSTKTSMCGSGKSSLGLALFKFRISMQTLIFPSFFGTTTILDTHCGYLTTSRKPAFHYFSSSALTLT